MNGIIDNNVLLSICIPTYNRSNYLKQSLDSIVCLKEFNEGSKVEIIISDNFSSDNTEILVKKYISLYGNKIKYYKNSSNISDKNFEKSLSYGNGEFLKLSNDTLIYTKDSLAEIILLIEESIINKPILFFLNDNSLATNKIEINTIDKLLKITSFKLGWIGSFGIWKSDFLELNDFSRRSNLQLAQIDVIFRVFLKKKCCIIATKKIHTTLELNSKGGYDILEVFLENYIFLLKEQHFLGNLSLEVYKKEKKKILLSFILTLILNILTDNKTKFQIKKMHHKVFNFCLDIPLTYFKFYLLLILKLPFYILKNTNIIRKYEK